RIDVAPGRTVAGLRREKRPIQLLRRRPRRVLRYPQTRADAPRARQATRVAHRSTSRSEPDAYGRRRAANRLQPGPRRTTTDQAQPARRVESAKGVELHPRQ